MFCFSLRRCFYLTSEGNMGSLKRWAALVPQVVWMLLTRFGAWCARPRMRTARGQGLVEYALILVLIAIVVIGVLSMLGARTSMVFDQVNCGLSGETYRQDNGNGNSNRCR
jgi:pilus assembly protein Flp/PilA